jgi:hypothetical protein
MAGSETPAQAAKSKQQASVAANADRVTKVQGGTCMLKAAISEGR